ncbi:MAG: glutamate 5-kinase [Anaerolineae bacterium]|nr:glutamate 5-kinase [Anaerolineae bacterium]
MNGKRIIIKFGTSTLTAGTPHISLARLFDLVRQIAGLRAAGHRIVLVSSGAVAAGREVLNYPELPRFIPAKQMLSAVGQPHLMGLYDQFFSMFKTPMAQVLLTREDLADRNRYLNARNTLNALLDQNIIPIINENDTVATEEIRVGDNDTLSAMVATLVEADLLILLTDQGGLFTGDPRHDPNARLVPLVDSAEIGEEIWASAGGSVSGLGTGGMFTKLRAADLARRGGTTVMIARGSDTDILLRLAAGENPGTCFTPVVSAIESRKRYLLSGMRASTAFIHVDEGAVRALKRNGSLLPVGVKTIEGAFERGDTVKVLSPSGKEIALGMVNYDSHETGLCAGHRSSDIEGLLGYTYGEEIIHRSNLLLL